VENQARHLLPYCDVTVIAPVRVFPHLRLWKRLIRPRSFLKEWKQWQAELRHIPFYRESDSGIPVFYPRYTSPPRQIFHGLWGFFAYPFLLNLLKDLHHSHHFDLVHAHYASPCGVIALLARRWMKLPVIVSIHGADVTYTAKQNPVSATIIRWVFRNADAILANSTWTMRQIVRYGGTPEKAQIVRLGGNPSDAMTNLQARRIRNEAINLLSVGYLEERKGHSYVLHALRRLRDEGHLRYVIVGDGSQREPLERLARSLGIDDIVSFEGYKPHQEVWRYFASCDIFVLPSWNEAFGIVYIEALSQGKPVIGCEGEGGPEDLKALGDCIELVKPRDVESLVVALRRLINDPERRRQMGEIGQRIVQEYFSWERNAADTFAIYCQILQR